MESAQEGSDEKELTLPAGVSILVVMESAQEAYLGVGTLLTGGSFNPCCNGKCSGRGGVGPAGPRTPVVSILVVMESAQEARQSVALSAGKNSFQSLL